MRSRRRRSRHRSHPNRESAEHLVLWPHRLERDSADPRDDVPMSRLTALVSVSLLCILLVLMALLVRSLSRAHSWQPAEPAVPVSR
jgi:hypothetical protein